MYKNSEKHRQYKEKWKTDNPLKISLYNAIRQARKRAENKGVPFTLTGGTAARMLDKSGGKCALSGLSFKPPETRGCPGPYSPSLDRIEASKGYTEDNTRLILNGLNALRGNGTDEDVLTICKAVIERNSK